MIERDDHIVENTKDQLITQYYDSENILSLANLFSQQAQNLTDIIHSMYTNRTINFAVGTQLDKLGNIVGASRQGLNDSQYRQRIRGKIASNTSEGTREEILQTALLSSNCERVYIGERRGEYEITIVNPDPPTQDFDAVKESIINATVSGVGVTLSESFQINLFSFIEDPDTDGRGFRDINILDAQGQVVETDTSLSLDPDAGFLTSIV